MPNQIDFSDLALTPSTSAPTIASAVPLSKDTLTPNNPLDRNIPLDKPNPDDDLPAGGGPAIVSPSSTNIDFSDLTGDKQAPPSPVSFASVFNPMPSLTNKPLADAIDRSYYGSSAGKNIDKQAYAESLKDEQAANAGLDDTSMASDVSAWLKTIPESNRKYVAQMELDKLGTTAAAGTLGLALLGGLGETVPTAIDVAKDLGAGVKTAGRLAYAGGKALIKGGIIPGAEEAGGWAVKKLAHAAGISQADPWIDKGVLLMQLASPGVVSKAAGGVNALSQLRDALKGKSEESSYEPEAVPSGQMQEIEPDPTMVTKPYTNGIGVGFQNNTYTTSPGSPILMPH